MRYRLKAISDQVMVITGASSGNGLGVAEMAAQNGASLVIAARSADALDQVASRLRQTGARIAVCVADVSTPGDVERIAQTALTEFGGFDTWVNNASVGAYGTLEQLTLEDHRRIMDVNYFGMLEGSLAAARHLRNRSGGAIINIGSVLGDSTMLLQGAYSASKHAVQAATETLRMELEGEGAPISVTLIQPGAMHTPFPERARSYLSKAPRLPPVLYDPRLVADAVIFAAQHRRRTLRVGSAGQFISIGRAFAPAFSEFLLKTFGRALQVSNDTGKPEWRDALFEPRPAGAVDGTQAVFVRKNSYLLQAQKYPVAAALIGVMAIAAGFAALQQIRRRK